MRQCWPLWQTAACRPSTRTAPRFSTDTLIDESYGGLAFEDEGARCAALFKDPKQKVMIMGNHGVLIIGATVAETFNRLYYFERAAETYIRALQTGQPLRILPDDIAEKPRKSSKATPNKTPATSPSSKPSLTKKAQTTLPDPFSF